jgi:hypothetical protein
VTFTLSWRILMADADKSSSNSPVGRPWCKLRAAVFAWTNARFTLLPRDRDTMHVTRHPIVTVIGRAFYDVGHASRNPHTNRRDYDRRLAVWEIHPVMKLVQNGP